MLCIAGASVTVKDGKFPKREAKLTEDTQAIATDADAVRAAAFERFADLRPDASYRLATLILRDAQEAEDATHDAFARAWRDLHRLRDDDGPTATWIRADRTSAPTAS